MAPIKTNIIIEYKTIKSFKIAGLNILNKNLSIITNKNGKYPKDNNPLSNAPHTMSDLVSDWDRPYSREQACFPPGSFKIDKYWAPVNRVDNAHGDKNLICSCPPMDEYLEAAE